MKYNILAIARNPNCNTINSGFPSNTVYDCNALIAMLASSRSCSILTLLCIIYDLNHFLPCIFLPTTIVDTTENNQDAANGIHCH